MERIESRINTSSPEYRQNFALMEAAVKQLREEVERVRQGGPEQSRRRHLERGKLLVRDRIRKLLDPQSAFMELSPLAAWGMYDDEAPGAGIVTGIGRLQGREVVVVANDATVKGGTYYPITVKKHLRAQEIALQNHLPCVYLVDSGGAFLPLQVGGLPRPRALRAHLLQHGADVGRGNPAGRGGDGIVHGGRRLRAGDVRREYHRARAGHDFPRRPAAGARGHRRGSHRRGTGRRRRAHAAQRRERSSGRRRRARARDRALDLREPRPSHRPRIRAAAGRSPRIRITTRARSTAWSRATRGGPTKCAN